MLKYVIMLKLIYYSIIQIGNIYTIAHINFLASAFTMTLSEQAMTVGESYSFSLSYVKPSGTKMFLSIIEDSDRPDVISTKVIFQHLQVSGIFELFDIQTNQYIGLESSATVSTTIDLADKPIKVPVYFISLQIR